MKRFLPFFLFGAVACGNIEVITEVDLGASFISTSRLADLNNDGSTTAIVSDFSRVLVVPSSGGEFQAPIDLALTEFPIEVQTADLDGDQLPEILINTGASILSSKNEGGLSFAAATTLISGIEQRAFAAADLLGADNLAEVATLASADFGTTFSLNIFRNTAGAIDPTPLSVALAIERFSPTEIVAGDLDSDGDTDLFLFGSQSDPQFLLTEQGVVLVTNNGDDTFTAGQELLTFGVTGFNSALTTGDLDNDQDVDFAFIGFDENFRSAPFLLKNDGGALSRVELPPLDGATSLLMSDLESDGDLDLAVTTRQDEAFGYQTEKIVLLRNEAGEFTTEEEQIRKIDNMILLGASDLNGDTLPDLWLTGNLSVDTLTLFGLSIK